MSTAASCHFEKPFETGKAPTVHPARFFLQNEDAEDLWKALNADKTDVETIINILAKRTLAQRLNIINAYRALHNANLVDDLENKLSGDLKKLIVALMTPMDQLYAKELHNAVAGLGTDESVLIEVLCTLNNTEIKAVRRSYHQIYNVYLEADIKDDTSGNFKQLLVSLCNTERDEHMQTDHNAAAADAQALMDASTSDDRWSIFSDVLLHRSYAQLRLIFRAFERLAGNNIEKTIADDFSGDVEDGLLAIVASVKNPPAFFAQKLNKSMAGLGTNDNDLVRLVVTRSEIDMEDVKQEYEVQFSKSLASAIADDTSGDYKTCLLILIGEPSV